MDRRGNAKAETVQCFRHMRRCTQMYEREERRVRGDQGERGHDNARRVGSEFRPHDLEGLGNVWSKNWVKGELMRGRIKSSGSLMGGPTARGNGKTASPSVVGGGSMMPLLAEIGHCAPSQRRTRRPPSVENGARLFLRGAKIVRPVAHRT